MSGQWEPESITTSIARLCSTIEEKIKSAEKRLGARNDARRPRQDHRFGFSPATKPEPAKKEVNPENPARASARAPRIIFVPYWLKAAIFATSLARVSPSLIGWERPGEGFLGPE